MENILASNAPNLNTEDLDSVESLAEQLIIQSLIAFPDCLNDYEIDIKSFHQPYYRWMYDIYTICNKENSPTTLDYLKVRFKDYFVDINFNNFFIEIWKYRDIKLNPNLKFYVDVLRKREMRDSFERLKWKTPRDKPIEETIELFIDDTTNLLKKYAPAPINTFDSVLLEVIEKAEKAAQGIFPHRIKTHFAELDRKLGECVLEDYLIILGGLPGTGKTTFALNWARNIAQFQKYSVLYISLEAISSRIMEWYIAAAAKIPYRKFGDGSLSDDEYGKISMILNELVKEPINILKTQTDIAVIVKTIRNYIKNTPNCKFVIVDHLHFITWSKSSNPTEVVSTATGALKQLAIELKTPILLLSQLMKPTKEDFNSIPHVGMLKGSGSIISDADLIIMLKQNINKFVGNNIRVIDAYVLKNRGGAADNQPVPLCHYVDKYLITGE